MSQAIQNYSNHVRRHPPYHFVLLPILLIHLVWSIIRLIKEPGWSASEALLLSIGLLLMGFLFESIRSKRKIA